MLVSDKQHNERNFKNVSADSYDCCGGRYRSVSDESKVGYGKHYSDKYLVSDVSHGLWRNTSYGNVAFHLTLTL